MALIGQVGNGGPVSVLHPYVTSASAISDLFNNQKHYKILLVPTQYYC
jgi:hypothetical protein